MPSFIWDHVLTKLGENWALQAPKVFMADSTPLLSLDQPKSPAGQGRKQTFRMIFATSTPFTPFLLHIMKIFCWSFQHDVCIFYGSKQTSSICLLIFSILPTHMLLFGNVCLSIFGIQNQNYVFSQRSSFTWFLS